MDLTVKRVCAGCNNGWLSKLEARVKPLLAPLIRGGNQTLTPNEAATAALWCAKTALIFQFIHPERRLAPDEHYYWLRERRTPPPNVFVWVAGYEGRQWSGWYLHQMLGFRDPGGPDKGDRGYCSTITAGAFAFQVIGVDAVDPVEIEKASVNEPYIAQVWPPKRNVVELPPPRRLDDISLPQFADPFGAFDPAQIVR
jgi:hypothetical protein